MFTKEELLVIEDALKIADAEYIKIMDESKSNKDDCRMSLLGRPFDNKLNTIPTGIKFSNVIIPKIKSPIETLPPITKLPKAFTKNPQSPFAIRL